MDASLGEGYRSMWMPRRPTTLLLPLLLALLGSLVVPAPALVRAADTRGATGATRATATSAAPAGSAGVPGALTARLQQLVDEERATLGAPGISAAVILPDDSRWIGQSGVADVAANVPVDETTTFAMGSITKTFVSATIHQLVEEGRLAFEDPLSTWYPSWPNAGNITVRMLLDHTSGIYDYFESPSYESLVFGRPTHHWTTAEILSLVRDPYFAPGAGYHYSNTNYVLLGQIIRRVTGRSPAAEIRERFLTPLGLADEHLQGEEPLPPTPAAHSYLRSGSGWADQSDGTRFRPNTSGATVASDAGAMLGSARDLAVWGRTLYSGDLLRPETLAEMETPSRYESYGLGARKWVISLEDRVAWGHTGSLRGTVNMVMHLPYEHITVAVMMNLGRVDPSPLARRLALNVWYALQVDPESALPPPLDSRGLTADYQVSATLDTAARTLAAHTTAQVRNTTQAPVGELAFELAPLGLGLAAMGEVTVDDAPVAPVLRDQTIVVPLEPPIDPASSVAVTIDYGATFATAADGFERRFSSAGGIFTAYRWIPWLSVERPFARPNEGEPYVTGVAGSVDVDLTTDVPLKVAIGGVRTINEATHQVFHATGLRDVAFAVSATYRMSSRTVDGVAIRAYGPTGDDARHLLDEAARALPRLVARLGPYPYATLSIARVTGGGAVVEAPAHAWIPATTESLSYAVTRAVAHQWFHASVGSDQPLDPFADEAPADHLARLLTGTLRPSTCPDGRLDLRVYTVSAQCFEERIAVGGANWLESLRRKVGDATYWQAMRAYLADHRDGFGGTRALLQAVDTASPLDLRNGYRPRFPRWF